MSCEGEGPATPRRAGLGPHDYLVMQIGHDTARRLKTERPPRSWWPECRLRVIFDCREALLTTVGQPQIAERLALSERFGGLSSDSFRGDRVATTEGAGQKRTKCIAANNAIRPPSCHAAVFNLTLASKPSSRRAFSVERYPLGSAML